MVNKCKLKVREKGLIGYKKTWSEMKGFVAERDPHTSDELWLLEHPPVYTLGQAGKEEHILDAASIEVVRSDRGGQVTYHGPGQLVGYLLLDLGRLQIGVKRLVTGIENAIIKLLDGYQLCGERLQFAPGVYIEGKKVAALGLRIRKGCSYHGLSLNVDLDLEPYSRINPCGYKQMEVTCLKDYGVQQNVVEVGRKLASCLGQEFGYGGLVEVQVQ